MTSGYEMDFSMDTVQVILVSIQAVTLNKVKSVCYHSTLNKARQRNKCMTVILNRTSFDGSSDNCSGKCRESGIACRNGGADQPKV